MVDTGLPTIFVAASSLALPDALLLAHPSVLEGDAAQMAKLEAVRCAAAQLTPELTRRLSPPAPKVCVVAPRAAYSTTGSEALRAETMDCLLRALSNGVSVLMLCRSDLLVSLTKAGQTASAPHSPRHDAVGRRGRTCLSRLGRLSRRCARRKRAVCRLACSDRDGLCGRGTGQSVQSDSRAARGSLERLSAAESNSRTGRREQSSIRPHAAHRETNNARPRPCASLLRAVRGLGKLHAAAAGTGRHRDGRPAAEQC